MADGFKSHTALCCVDTLQDGSPLGSLDNGSTHV